MKSRFVLITVLLMLIGFMARPPLAAQENELEFQRSEQLVYVWAGQSDTIPPFVLSPAGLDPQTPTANITVNYIGSWTGPAQNAFEYAVTIWEGLLVSTVAIKVNAEWSGSLPPGALGGAGPYDFYGNFPNSPQANTWYPIALANTYAGYDLNGSDPEVDSVFSSTFSNWYFGTDGNTPGGTYDFVTVVLHELGHGLGFTGSMRVQGGLGNWGYGSTYPFIYDRFTENGAGQALLSFPNNSGALASQLTGGSVYFDGPNANAANSGSRPRLYAPGTWQQGSSYSHLDESTFPGGTTNALMTPQISSGEANHNPGPIALGIFKDSGWTLANQNTAPVMNPLPSQLMLVGTTRNNAIDLWAYTSDAQTPDSALVFAITNSPNANAGVSLDSNRYIDVFPAGAWTGSTLVTVRVTDPGGLTHSQSFTVAVVNQILNAYLPMVQK